MSQHSQQVHHSLHRRAHLFSRVMANATQSPGLWQSSHISYGLQCLPLPKPSRIPYSCAHPNNTKRVALCASRRPRLWGGSPSDPLNIRTTGKLSPQGSKHLALGARTSSKTSASEPGQHSLWDQLSSPDSKACLTHCCTGALVQARMGFWDRQGLQARLGLAIPQKCPTCVPWPVQLSREVLFVCCFPLGRLGLVEYILASLSLSVK